jgi:endonuclease/exonuclease/phosphatase family metal-dependent hydrolase
MSADPGRVRALSWNLHGFVGRSGQRDPVPALAAVRELAADIVALQEVDERRREPGDARDFDALRETFGPHSAEARTLRSPDGDYGHLLMSRWPMHDVVRLDLGVARREPRMAISCRVESPAGAIRVLAAHLGLSAAERGHQLDVIRRHLAATDEDAAIVLGDFNEWRRVGAATRALCPPFEPAVAKASFPARFPLLALDRIFSRAPLRPLAGTTVRAYRQLSDHLPVVADFACADRN